MAWPDDPLPPIRHERHFGDRLVRCFIERPPSLYGLLEAAIGRDPDALALIEGDARLTYRGLARQVERLAAGLAARGVAPKDRVARLIGNRPELVVTRFAAARLGPIAVPLGVVPAMYHLCLLEPDLAALDLSSWRIGGDGGAPMTEAAITKLAERLPQLQLSNSYGATELPRRPC